MMKTKEELKNFIDALNKKPGEYTQEELYQIVADSLNIRKGAGTSYDVVGTVKKGEVYTIVEKKNNFGKLKSGAGWISINEKYAVPKK